MTESLPPVFPTGPTPDIRAEEASRAFEQLRTDIVALIVSGLLLGFALG